VKVRRIIEPGTSLAHTAAVGAVRKAMLDDAGATWPISRT
jgi:hypothetical protein